MKPINMEYLMGHSTGINDSYYRPTENEVFQDYSRAVDSLTIQDTNSFKKRFQEISEKSMKREIMINTKLLEKEKEIESLSNRDSMNSDAIAYLSDQLVKVMEDVRALKRDSK